MAENTEDDFDKQERIWAEENREPNDRTKELAKKLSDFVNTYSKQDQEDLVKLILRDHPTLQQSTIGLFIKTIEAMAVKERVDGRNEDSKLVCNQMIEGFKEVRAKADTIRHKHNYSVNDMSLPSNYLPFI